MQLDSAARFITRLTFLTTFLGAGAAAFALGAAAFLGRENFGTETLGAALFLTALVPAGAALAFFTGAAFFIAFVAKRGPVKAVVEAKEHRTIATESFMAVRKVSVTARDETRTKRDRGER